MCSNSAQILGYEFARGLLSFLSEEGGEIFDGIASVGRIVHLLPRGLTFLTSPPLPLVTP